MIHPHILGLAGRGAHTVVIRGICIPLLLERFHKPVAPCGVGLAAACVYRCGEIPGVIHCNGGIAAFVPHFYPRQESVSAAAVHQYDRRHRRGRIGILREAYIGKHLGFAPVFGHTLIPYRFNAGICARGVKFRNFIKHRRGVYRLFKALGDLFFVGHVFIVLLFMLPIAELSRHVFRKRKLIKYIAAFIGKAGGSHINIERFRCFYILQHCVFPIPTQLIASEAQPAAKAVRDDDRGGLALTHAGRIARFRLENRAIGAGKNGILRRKIRLLSVCCRHHAHTQCAARFVAHPKAEIASALRKGFAYAFTLECIGLTPRICIGQNREHAFALIAHIFIIGYRKLRIAYAVAR